MCHRRVRLPRFFAVVVALVGALYFAYLVRNTLWAAFYCGFSCCGNGSGCHFFSGRHLRALAILLVYVLIGLIIFGVGLVVVPPVVSQIDGLAQHIPGYLEDMRKNDTFLRYDDKYEITQKLSEQASSLPSRLGDAAGALQAVTVGAFSAAVKLVTVLTISFFLLLDGGRIVRFLFGLLKQNHQRRYTLIADKVYRAVAGYVLGNLLISVVAGLVTYITLSLLNVPFAVPLAVLMVFLDLVPLVGATIAGVTILLVTLFNDFPTSSIVWAVVFVVYQQAENNLLQPIVYRRTVDVPPLVVIVAILIGTSLLGVLGALVAIPVAAAVQILVKDAWQNHRLSSGNGGENGLNDDLSPPISPAAAS